MTYQLLNYPRLVADIGGTNARFAIETAPFELTRTEVLRCADYDSLLAAISAYLDKQALSVPENVGIAIANPVNGDLIQMTNHHWGFSIRELKAQLGIKHLVVINDFTAQALAVGRIPKSGLGHLNGPLLADPTPKTQVCAVVGPGTGLGVSGLIPDRRGGMLALSGEGGHVTFAPVNALEQELKTYAHGIFGDHVSFERILQGVGLTLIYRFMAERNGVAISKNTPAEVTHAALVDKDALCIEVLSLYCAILGGFCADVVLTIGAMGGLYIAGGIIPRFKDFVKASDFRQRFEAKGRFRDYLSQVPVYVVEQRHSGVLGAAVALDNQLKLLNR